MPLMGADKSVVQRTQYFNYECLNERPVQYAAYFSFTRTTSLFKWLFFGPLFAYLAKYEFGRGLLLKVTTFVALFFLSSSSSNIVADNDLTTHVSSTIDSFRAAWQPKSKQQVIRFVCMLRR